jgi:uncharacterized membrane protein YphA (DoxX/SURF4 family)
LLIAGICLPFLFSGVTKLIDYNAAVAEFAAAGLPAWWVPLTIALQLGASISAIALRGVPASVGALALAAFTIAATVIAHSHELVIFAEHLSITFALVFVAWWNWRPAPYRGRRWNPPSGPSRSSEVAHR